MIINQFDEKWRCKLNYALLTAGGVGSRMHMDIPKQFICVNEKPIIVYTLEKFQTHPDIDGICVVCLDGWKDILKSYAEKYSITKLKWIASGGKNGQQSIISGVRTLEKYINKDDIVIISDGNRPFVSHDIISDAIVKSKMYGSAVSHTPCVEAMYVKDEHDDNLSSEQSLFSNTLLDRNKLIKAQTPNAFPLKKLLWAYGEAEKRGITDSVASCTLMTELGEKVYFSMGSPMNFKITTQEDLILFKAMVDNGIR